MVAETATPQSGSIHIAHHDQGAVLRCPACDGVVVRIVQTPTAILVDVRGAAWLRFDRR